MIGYLNTKISVNASFIREFCVPESYFPSEIVKLSNDEVFCDCGAFDGDTITIFKEKMKEQKLNYKSIYAIEPDKSNFEKLIRTHAGDKNFFPINKGVWDSKENLSFNDNEGGGSNINSSGKCQISVDRLDDLIDEKITLIKMDLEGAELRALKGAEITIEKYKPKLAIAVYHKIEDLFEIPRYIKKINSNYKFFLRAQCYDSTDLTLYAIDKF